MIVQPPTGPVEIRILHEIEELRACEAITKLVWQADDREIVPASHLRAIQHAGGMVAGAVRDGRMVGFVVGFLARHEPNDELGLHSHLLAVLPEQRRLGVGRALKWFQRRWCLERGIPWISWTFDPLQSHNARLNLEQLGAVGEAYLPDFYGSLGGLLAGGLATDRVMARWVLDAPHVLRLAGGAAAPAEGAEAEAAERTPWALSRGAAGGPEPTAGAADGASHRLRVAVPDDFLRMMREDPEAARAWRVASREVLTAAFDRGYRAVRFTRGSYLLEQGDDASAGDDPTVRQPVASRQGPRAVPSVPSEVDPAACSPDIGVRTAETRTAESRTAGALKTEPRTAAAPKTGSRSRSA